MPGRDEEFQKGCVFLKHICDDYRFTKMTLSVFHVGRDRSADSLNVQPSPLHCHNMDRLEGQSGQ